MDLMLLRIFQRQVADQCRLVQESVAVIDDAVTVGDQDRLWIGCQMFVVGAGNVSKVLWGQGPARAKVAPRRQPLRDSLGVSDSSPLFEVRIRNNFEHYDERIDEWWRRSKSHNHLDRMIGSPSMVAGLDDIDRFRVYDPATAQIFFWGEPFDLRPIADECTRIGPVAEREADKPHWEPHQPSSGGKGQ